MENKLIKKLEAGGHGFGTFAEIGGANSIEALGTTGLDFVIIDNEHSPHEGEASAEMIRAAELAGITALCRVREISRPAIMKLLDIGAGGLIVPCVETVEQVKSIVKYAKFAPIGERGFCGTRKDGWGFTYPGPESFETQMAYWNKETMLIPQCETVGCLEHIEEIAALDGVDGIMIGPFDLSISMGMPGKFDDPVFKAAIERILKAVKAAGKYAMVFTPTTANVKAYYEQGFDLVVFSLDAAVLIDAYRKIVAEVS
ncbi:MAG: aldolase/citrate lyase family protein [Eubacteriales bacterium]|nr:aldolase/citrate lyase family protein [Eubacteriales bacterium]